MMDIKFGGAAPQPIPAGEGAANVQSRFTTKAVTAKKATTAKAVRIAGTSRMKASVRPRTPAFPSQKVAVTRRRLYRGRPVNRGKIWCPTPKIIIVMKPARFRWT